MIPTLSVFDEPADFTIVRHNTKTYKVKFDGTASSGMLDGLEALKQSIYMILHTERYKWAVFSWNYGTELAQCIGETDRTLAKLNIQRAVTAALTQDDRVEDVTDFQFTDQRDSILVSFTVSSTEGEVKSDQIFDIGLEVEI